MCMAALQNHDHRKTCQKVYFICPGKGSEPSPQIAIKFPKLLTSSCIRATIPQAKKANTIIGDIQLAAFETIPYPFEAIQVVSPPRTTTIKIQVKLLGITSVSFGISIFVGTPTAVAETVIIEPAKKQKRTPLARL